MTSGDDPSLRTLFVEAIEIEDPVERAAFLDRHCGRETDIRLRVDALIRAHDLPGGFLPAGPVVSPSVDEGPGSVIGPYLLREKLGEGGWGVVYVAEQSVPVRRTVALKVIKPGMDTRQVLARFEAERQALALMEHPNIAKVLDAGATARGRPYFVMERVEGLRITDHCDRRRLGIRERIERVLQVCHAVQHAHQKGIIHRDLKPSNLLVAEQDGVAIPKVIDFGIAKSTGAPQEDETVFTQWHQFLGTPAYVSPEQVSGGDIDTRSDIYSLGVLLYELLTGGTPFDGRELMKSGLAAIRKTVVEIDPPVPSARVRSLVGAEAAVRSAARSMSQVRWASALAGDLDAVVMKCLEKDPARRYPTAHGLAQDLRCYLSGEAVQARPSGPGYRFRKWVGRHRVAVGTGCAVLLALCATAGFSAWAWRREAAARAAEERQRTRAEAGERAARRSGYVADMNLAQVALERNQVGRLREILGRSVPVVGQEDLRQWEWRWLSRESRGDAQSTLVRGKGPILAVRRTHRGEVLVRDGAGRVEVLDPESRRVILKVEGGSSRKALALSDDGRTAAWDHPQPEGGPGIDVWRAPWAEPLASLAIAAEALTLALSPTADRVAVYGIDGAVRVHDTATGMELGAVSVSKPEGIHKGVLAYAPNGGVLAFGGTDGWIHLLDARTLRTVRSWQASKEGITAMAFSPDSLRLASGAGFSDPTIRIWSTDSGVGLAMLDGHASWVGSLAFAPDGRSLASGGGDQTVRVWDTGADKPVVRSVFRGHVDEVNGVAWSGDGQSLLSAGKDGLVLSWDPLGLAPGGGYRLAPVSVATFAFLADGRRFVAAGWDGDLVLCGLPHVGPMTTEVMGRVDGTFGEVSLSVDGSCVAVGTDTGSVEVWEIEGRRRRASGKAGTAIPVLLRAGVGAGEWWVVDQGGGVRWWHESESMPEPGWRLPGGIVAASLSPDGRRLASVHLDGILRVADARDGRAPVASVRVTGLFTDVVHAPDGRTLVTTGEDGIVRIWDAGTLGLEAELRGHIQSAWSVAFSRDGRRMLTGGHGREAVKLWDPMDRAEVGMLAGEGARFYRVRFSLDGRFVGAVSRGGALHFWEAEVPGP